MQDVLEETMKLAFKDKLGNESAFGFEMGTGEHIIPSEHPIEPDIAGLLEPVGYESRLKAFRALREPI